MSWLRTLSSVVSLVKVVGILNQVFKRDPPTDDQVATLEILDAMLQEDGFDTAHNFEEKGDMITVPYVRVESEIPLWIPDGVKFPLTLEVGIDRQGRICHAELLVASWSDDVVALDVLSEVRQLFAKRSGP